MTSDQEKAAGAVRTPAAANVIPLRNARSVVARAGVGNADSAANLLANAWALLAARYHCKPVARIAMRPQDTRASRRYTAELTADLRMRVRDADGSIVVESPPLVRTGGRP